MLLMQKKGLISLFNRQIFNNNNSFSCINLGIPVILQIVHEGMAQKRDTFRRQQKKK